MKTDRTISAGQLPQNTILYLNSNLTKKCKSLLTVLYKYQSLQHKELAEILGIQTNGLTNLITRINTTQNEFIKSQTIGRRKIYSLSSLAEAYTEIILLPEEAAREDGHPSFFYNDPSLCEVLNSLKKFQEVEGDNWYIILDNLLFLETINDSTKYINFKDKLTHYYVKIQEETYQNYTNLKNALINLIVQCGEQAVRKIYTILDQKVLSYRFDSLLKDILADFYKMEPLFQLEEEDLQAAYTIIDRIFSECFPEIFAANSIVYTKPLEAKYSSIYSVIINMKNEFKNNNYDKALSIEQWENKFYVKKHFSCISYIAEKCSTIYLRELQ